MRLHRELFGENEEEEKSKRVELFSISRNLIQRKHEQPTATANNSLEIDKMFAVNVKEIDSIAPASMNREKFNDFARTNPVNKMTTSSSFLASLKSLLKCTNAATKKINEQIQLNYPLNLHLRMNQIFSLHDKLCDNAEMFNDLYSIGMFDWLKREDENPCEFIFDSNLLQCTDEFDVECKFFFMILNLIWQFHVQSIKKNYVEFLSSLQLCKFFLLYFQLSEMVVNVVGAFIMVLFGIFFQTKVSIKCMSKDIFFLILINFCRLCFGRMASKLNCFALHHPTFSGAFLSRPLFMLFYEYAGMCIKNPLNLMSHARINETWFHYRSHCLCFCEFKREIRGRNLKFKKTGIQIKTLIL